MKNYILNKWQNAALKLAMTILLMTGLFAQATYAQTTRTVGATGADYTTLKAAFDAINSGAITGAITLQIVDNTTEIASAVLYQSGWIFAGSISSYTSVAIYPTVSGKSISGTIDGAPLIHLSGADSVTFDGRVNATGSSADLTISNASISSTLLTSTIRFFNDAQYNTIKYCTVTGSTTANNTGIIFIANTGFSEATSGNNYNTISNNNITNAGGNRPVIAINSSGGAGATVCNHDCTISNNNIYDFTLSLASTGSIAGIYVYNSASFTISGNSFYETTNFAPAGSNAFNIIWAGANSDYNTNLTVSGNYIGGSARQCGGTPWVKTNSNTNAFTAMYIYAPLGAACNVQGNIIRNISISNNSTYGSAVYNLVYLNGGNINFGTTSPNIIGSSTGSGSISYTFNNASQQHAVYCINANPSTFGITDIENNSIGSIKISNAQAIPGAVAVYGIYMGGVN